LGAPVGEVGKGIVLVRTARFGGTAAGLSVEVGYRRYGDDIGVVGGEEARGVLVAVAGGDDHHNALVDNVLDRGRGCRVRTAVAAKAKVDHLDRGRPGRDPVKARYDGGEGAAAGVVENLYRMQPGAGCHPDHTDAVVDRRCATSHVSAVPVSVVTLVVLA